jgi:hypothetical protein
LVAWADKRAVARSARNIGQAGTAEPKDMRLGAIHVVLYHVIKHR